MRTLKSGAATLLAGAALVTLAISASAVEVTTSPSAAGPLTIALTCDTGPSGSGTFVVTANGTSSTVTVKCGKSATVSNAAWTAGSTAVIHQTAAPNGALRGRNVSVKLTTAAQTVKIRNFKPAPVATLAQTGGGLPMAPLGIGFAGLILLAIGGRLMARRV